MKYENPELSILCFGSDDVITTSGGNKEEEDWEDEDSRPGGWL